MVWRFRPDTLILREINRIKAASTQSAGPAGAAGATGATGAAGSAGALGATGAAGPAGAAGAVGAPGVSSSPPALVSAAIPANGLSIVLTYSKALDAASVPSPGDFTLFGVAALISSVGVSGSAVTLTFSAAAVTGGIIGLRYARGSAPIRDNTAHNAPSIEYQAVTNSSTVPASAAAPTVVFVSALATSASGTTRAPNGSAFLFQVGDIVEIQCLSRQSGTNATTAPAGEGFSLVTDGTNTASYRAAGYTHDIYQKRWGSGSTDNTSPIFTFATGGSSIAAVMVVKRGAKATGNPFSQVSAVQLPGAVTPMTTALSSVSAAATSMTDWFFTSSDNNAHGTPSRGTMAYGGASYNVGTSPRGAMSLAYEAGVDSHVNSCTMAQTALSPDSSANFTLVLDGEIPNTNGWVATQIGSNAAGKTRTNSTGWCEGDVTDMLPRTIGGVLCWVSVDLWVTLAQTLEIRLYKEPYAGGARVLIDSYTSPVIPNPAGITGLWTSDAHFTPTATFSKSGRLMVALLAHGNESPMQFGKAGAIGSCQITLGDFTALSDVSYPALMQVGDGTAILVCRQGVAGGNGWQTLAEENPAEDGWTQIASKILKHSADAQSPYMNRVVVDPVRDWLHLAWIQAASSFSKGYHGLCYARAVRTAPLTWHGEDVDGNTVAFPFTELTPNVLVDDCPMTLAVADQPFCVHNGGSYDPATGLPLLVWLKASTTTHGQGTDLWVGDRVSGAWVKRNVRQVHTVWDMVGVPPNTNPVAGVPERAIVRGADRFIWKGKQRITLTSDIELGSSGVPCLRAQDSTDGGVTWGSPYNLADVRFYGSCPRFNMVELTKRGRLRYLLTEQCDDGDGLFSELTVGNVGILELT